MVIKLTSKSSKSSGFLCPDSIHSFNIDGKRWITVQHYVYAMKFKGTPLENLIRTTRTVSQILDLAKGQSRIVDGKRVQVYYENSEPDPKWSSKLKELYNKAYTAKFEQNPVLKERLLNTMTEKIESDEPIIAAVLMEIRSASKDTSKPMSLKCKGEWREVYKQFIDILIKLMDLECWNKLHSEMIDDTIKNMVDSSIISNSLDKKTLYSSIMNHISRNDKYANHEMDSTIILDTRKIRKDLIDIDPYQSAQTEPSLKIAIFKNWVENNCDDLVISKEPISSVKLSPSYRMYRANPPLMPKPFIKDPEIIKTIKNWGRDKLFDYNRTFGIIRDSGIFSFVNMDRSKWQYILQKTIIKKLYGCDISSELIKKNSVWYIQETVKYLEEELFQISEVENPQVVLKLVEERSSIPKDFKFTLEGVLSIVCYITKVLIKLRKYFDKQQGYYYSDIISSILLSVKDVDEFKQTLESSIDVFKTDEEAKSIVNNDSLWELTNDLVPDFNSTLKYNSYILAQKLLSFIDSSPPSYSRMYGFYITISKKLEHRENKQNIP